MRRQSATVQKQCRAYSAPDAQAGGTHAAPQGPHALCPRHGSSNSEHAPASSSATAGQDFPRAGGCCATPRSTACGRLRLQPRLYHVQGLQQATASTRRKISTIHCEACDRWLTWSPRRPRRRRQTPGRHSLLFVRPVRPLVAAPCPGWHALSHRWRLNSVSAGHRPRRSRHCNP